MSPKISAIIPTYNRATVVSRAIRSVLAQSCDDFELIIVDDGSTDPTPQALATFDDPRLRIIHQPNAGLSAARNRGVAESVGEYLAFLDDDDEFLPRKLEHQLAYLEQHSEAGLVAGGHECVDDNGNVLAIAEPWVDGDNLSVEYWLRKCPFLLQSILLRRVWWERVGGLDTDLRQAMDHIFFLRLAALGCSMHWNQETVLRYCIHSGGMSQNAYRLTQFRIKGLAKFFESDIAPEWAKSARDEWFAHHWVIGAMQAYALGQIDEAKQCLLLALKHDPRLLSEKAHGVIDQIVEFSQSPLLSIPSVEYIRLVFEQLPDELAGLKKYARTAKGHFYMHRFFEGYKQGDLKAVLRSVVPGILNDPTWLRNRGVWSITAKSLLHRVRQICLSMFSI